MEVLAILFEQFAMLYSQDHDFLKWFGKIFEFLVIKKLDLDSPKTFDPNLDQWIQIWNTFTLKVEKPHSRLKHAKNTVPASSQESLSNLVINYGSLF